jgi:hypothetical protein
VLAEDELSRVVACDFCSGGGSGGGEVCVCVYEAVRRVRTGLYVELSGLVAKVRKSFDAAWVGPVRCRPISAPATPHCSLSSSCVCHVYGSALEAAGPVQQSAFSAILLHHGEYYYVMVLL